MQLDFITLFPEMILQALGHSMMKRAAEAGAVAYRAANPRDFTHDRHRTVDDKPFGGGAGMLMMPGPVLDAVRSLDPKDKKEPGTAYLLPDPTGRLFTQADAQRLAQSSRVVILCGHYEGIDARVPEILNAERFSIGDYVLTGGELPALVIADAIVRLLPGVLGSPESLDQDSFSDDGLLTAPQYTRPEVFEGHAIPEILRSGDHGAIARWKRRQALLQTRAQRPDLFCRARIARNDLDVL